VCCCRCLSQLTIDNVSSVAEDFPMLFLILQPCSPGVVVLCCFSVCVSVCVYHRHTALQRDYISMSKQSSVSDSSLAQICYSLPQLERYAAVLLHTAVAKEIKVGETNV